MSTESRKTAVQNRSLTQASKLSRRLHRLSSKIERVQARVAALRQARLWAAGVFFVGIVLSAVKPEFHLALPTVLIFLPLFTVMVMRTGRAVGHLRYLSRLHAFYDRQRRRCLGISLERTETFSPDLRPAFAHDLNLFGSDSLWTLIDETQTTWGRARLLDWLNDTPVTAVVLARQTQTRAMKNLRWFFTKLGALIESGDIESSGAQFRAYVKTRLTPEKFSRTLIGVWVLWVGTIACFGLSKFGVSEAATYGKVFYLIFLIANQRALSKLGLVFKKGVGLSHHFSVLAPLLSGIEERAKRAPSLAALAPRLLALSPARSIRRLEVAVGWVGTEANPILHLLINAVSPWSITAIAHLESQRARLAQGFDDVLEEVGEIEAYGSLVLFSHYQTDRYPEFREGAFEFEGMFHPLISRESAVANSFKFPGGKTVGLLTGSNMSGKSTFLRTMGLNQVLANAGAPVFADSFKSDIRPIASCIEVSDSLRDGFSYFYAEVRRLRQILERAKAEPKLLFLIDEIFKGTNNRERQIGSRAVIRTLAGDARDGALGFVSTHDLELTTLEKPASSVLNLHFRDHVENGQMSFTYKLSLGPSPTTNALVIMEQEGISIQAEDRLNALDEKP